LTIVLKFSEIKSLWSWPNGMFDKREGLQCAVAEVFCTCQKLITGIPIE